MQIFPSSFSPLQVRKQRKAAEHTCYPTLLLSHHCTSAGRGCRAQGPIAAARQPRCPLQPWCPGHERAAHCGLTSGLSRGPVCKAGGG
eukprot:1159008-Pelagomonas_calceolata.AAC.3